MIYKHAQNQFKTGFKLVFGLKFYSIKKNSTRNFFKGTRKSSRLFGVFFRTKKSFRVLDLVLNTLYKIHVVSYLKQQ